MAVLGLAIFFILIFLLSTFLKSKSTNKPIQAPRVPGAWPIIGHLPHLAPPNLPHVVLGHLADIHGPIFTLKLGRESVLVVSSSKYTKEIFTTNDTSVVYRPSLAAAKIVGYNDALFPFHPGGPYWQQTRKISVFELLSNQRVEQLKHCRIEEVKTSIQELYKACWISKRTVEMKQWLAHLNMNALVRMVIGRKFSGSSIEEQRRFSKGIMEINHFLGAVDLRDFIPFLSWIDLGGQDKKMKKSAEEIDEFLGKWLDEHKKKRFLEEKDGKEDKDFMDSVISFTDGKNIEGYDADTVCKATCLGLIAGYESTAATLAWAVSLLLNNKEVMKKAQQELDIQIGNQRLVTDEDISKLPYLQAIVKESLRLYPPTFIPGPRKFAEDCTIGGYHVPKDTWLMMNLSKIHTDPDQWPIDPMEFKPERFLTTHREVDVWGQHFELLPFGSGRRGCPAKSYGIQMVQLTLATLLHAFDISTPNGEPVDMTPSVGITNMRVTNLEIVASPRLPSHCFE